MAGAESTIINTTVTISALGIKPATATAWNALVKPGDIMAFADGSTVQILGAAVGTNTNPANPGTLVVPATLGATKTGAPLSGSGSFVLKRPEPSRRLNAFEVIWKPMCLSVFKYSGALPVGKYELICTPHNDNGNNLQIRAVETPVHNITSADQTTYNFTVSDCRFYAAQVVGERVEDMTYYIDLENTRVQMGLIKKTQGLSKDYYDVSPTTYGLTVAYQDVAAGIDTRRSCSRFTVGDNKELQITRLFLQYAGKSFPQPDADPSFKIGKQEDYTTQRYIETSINSGAYFSGGGGESIKSWQKRGAIHYFSTPKDGQDRCTRVTVNQQFATKFDDEANLMLFDHSKQCCKVTVQRGLVVSAEVLDA